MTETCPTCKGTGKTFGLTCRTYDGDGNVPENTQKEKEKEPMGLFGPSKKDLARLTRQKAPEIERAAHDAEEEARDLDRIAHDFRKSGDPELAELYRKDAAEARWAAKRLTARAADARRGITSW